MDRAATDSRKTGSSKGWPVATALRETIRGGYTLGQFRSDALAGVVTGIVAVPLSMALAIAVGLPPQYGLYTAIVAGALIALCGGTRTSVSGPTAAFVVILVPVVATHGLAGLCIASMIAGLILVMLGIAGLGRLIEFVPYPVTTGFTSGIAVVIATLQIKDFLGLTVAPMPEHYVGRLWVLVQSLPTLRWSDFAVGSATVILLIVWPRYSRRVPAPLIALTIVATASFSINHFAPEFKPGTINDGRFVFLSQSGEQIAGIPQSPPLPTLPSQLPGPNGKPLNVNLNVIRELVIPALAIALLGSIESLLCAVVATGMTGHRHDPDAELIAQGAGNIVAPFFGGFAATAAIARTATGIRAGAQSPIASFCHAVFVLLAMVFFAPVLGYLPMASLAALLLVVAWNMSEARHFVKMLRVAPRSDIVVLLACFSLTVLFDMVVSVFVGVVLSALLFMRRMAEISGARLIAGSHPQLVAPLPEDVFLYIIQGPLFFGAAEKAAGAILTANAGARVVILDMAAVPAMDVTGLVALQSAIGKLQRAGVYVVLAAVQAQPNSLLKRAGVTRDPGKLSICQTLAEAETLVRLVLPEHRSKSTARSR